MQLSGSTVTGPNIFEIRSYTNGWIASLGRLSFIWNTQERYSSFEIKWRKPKMKFVGGKIIASV